MIREQYLETKKAERIKDKDVGVTEKLLEKAEFTAIYLKEVAGVAAQEAVERTLHERSASDSSVMRELIALRKQVEVMQVTIDGWRSGTKIAFWAFVFIGGIITWILNSFGIHFGIR